MIMLQRLLNSSIFILGLIGSIAHAQGNFCKKEFNVLERNKKDKYVFVKKELVDFNCTDKFEGKYFKIVKGTDEVAISFDDQDGEILKKAANTYYHLTVARTFWTNKIESDYVESLPQIVIRLDITNSFSSSRHYKNAEQEKNFNNAWTIPAGQTPSFAIEKKKWGKEIWFSPMKRIESRKEVISKGENPIHESLVFIKDPIIATNKNAFIYQTMAMLVAPEVNQSFLLDSALKRLGTIAVIYGLIETTKHMDKWFMEKYYFIDTAMVPEIIYHEYAHIAMSDTMKTVHSIPVIEGMADYFAARIVTNRYMYSGIKGFSNNRTKDKNNKSFYHPFLEGAWNATSDFSLSLLWLGKTEFDLQNEKREKKGQDHIGDYDQIVHNAHFHMNEDTDIMNGLTSALVKSCETLCESTRAGVNTLNLVFEKKGLN